nr:hypothetical protein [Tanacetum cinerariifolium]
MPPWMTTRSAGHATASLREGRKGRQTIKEVVKLQVDLVIREIEEFMLKNLLPAILAQVGNKGSNQGNRMNQNDDAINDNILGNVRNVIVNNDQRGFTYKEFLACNSKEYDDSGVDPFMSLVTFQIWPPRVTLGRLLPHARGLGFKPRRGGFLSGAKNEWGLSPKAKVRVLHTAQLDVTVSSNH